MAEKILRFIIDRTPAIGPSVKCITCDYLCTTVHDPKVWIEDHTWKKHIRITLAEDT